MPSSILLQSDSSLGIFRENEVLTAKSLILIALFDYCLN